jgi:hypothetical protein
MSAQSHARHDAIRKVCGGTQKGLKTLKTLYGVVGIGAVFETERTSVPNRSFVFAK